MGIAPTETYAREPRKTMPKPPDSSHLSALAPRLLLVDDDPAVLRGLRRMIGNTHPQWCILEAHDGGSALAVLERHPVHTIIADLQMPGMDGLALLGRVARDFPATLRVVHSSLLTVGNSRGIQQLAQARIPKPVNPTSLVAVLDWALGGGSVAAGGSAA